MGNNIKESSTNQMNREMLSDRCGVNDTLALIGKRWLMTILYEVSLGNNQFSSLGKAVTGISQNVLGLRVNDLVKEGLIIKSKVENTIPLQIIYIITPKGIQLLQLIDGLSSWNRNWKN